MKFHFVEDPIPYNGEALSNHWTYRNFGILGDSVVSFMGPCEVPLERMVDLEDVLNNDAIYSTNMLHFIVEIFGIPLREGVLLQRLFTCVIQSKINMLLDSDVIKRRGDDLFFNDTQKLSVSICTMSPSSILIHTGLNIESANTPVETAGLTSDLALDKIPAFATSCMKTLVEEWEDIKLSCCKVKAVY
jgi:uncharacterized protein